MMWIQKLSICSIVTLLILVGLPVSSGGDITDMHTTLITKQSDYDVLPYHSHIVDKRVYHRDVLCEGHLPMIIQVQSSLSSVALQKNDLSKLLKVSNVNKKAGTFDYEILVNTSFVNYTTVYTQTIDKNGSKIQVPKDIEFTDYRWVWTSIESLDSLVIPNSGYIVLDVVGHLKAQLGLRKLDIIPTIAIADFSKECKEYAWWDASWLYYTPIYIQSEYMKSTLRNFTIMVNITDSTLLSRCQTDGDDIRFITSDNLTEYKYEKEYFSASRYAIYWVNITKVSGTADTTVILYYGNAVASNNEQRKSTWDSKYRTVYHMNQTSGNIVDSTSNNYNSTSTASDPTYYQKGISWKSINYDDINDGHVIPQIITKAEMDASGIAVEAWVYLNSYSDPQTIAEIKNSPYVSMRIRTAGHVFSVYSGGGYVSAGVVNSGKWYYLVYMWNTTSNAHLYINGKLDTSGAQGATEARAGVNYVGNVDGASLGLFGMDDEVRITKGLRNTSWFNATFRFQNNSANGKILLWGSEHTAESTRYINYSTVYPTNGSLSVCVCCDMLSINLTFTRPTNPTFIRFESNITGSWKPMVNYTETAYNGYHQYLACHYFNLSDHTYYWRVYTKTGTTSNTSGVYHLKTMRDNINCSIVPAPLSTGSGGSSVQSKDVAGLLGMIGIFGLFGYFLNRRRKR